MIKTFFAIISASLIYACSTPMMVMNNSSQEPVESFRVKGRNGFKLNQKLRFGNYTTSAIQRSWVRGRDENLGLVGMYWTHYENKNQTVRFALNDEKGRASKVFCVTRVLSKDFIIGRNPSSLVNILSDLDGFGDFSDNNFTVDIYAGKGNNGWQMIIDNIRAQQHSKSYVGYLAKDKDNYYSIIPARDLQVKGKTRTVPFGLVGFEFRNRAGQTVAAVSFMNEGTVYLAAVNEQEKFVLANACAALMLQEYID